jgi:hypothetical protein
MTVRNRKIGAIKTELLIKSREAMLTAVQIFNNLNIQFKSESFIVLSVISWTYLLHSFYRTNKIEYRYFDQKEKRRKFHKTKNDADKYWELERCLNEKKFPIDKVAKSNLLFLIGLRHEIEHQMTTNIADYLSARFQACCLNYNSYIKKLFGEKYGIDKHLSFSLQFSSIDIEQIKQLKEFTDLPKNIATFINKFDEDISEIDFNDMRYSYRVLYLPKSVNHKGQADRVIEFLPANSPEAEKLNKEYVLIKEREKKKYLPNEIWTFIQNKGYPKFKQYQHTQLWKTEKAKEINKGFGVQVATTWYWYENWKNYVLNYCQKNRSKFE